MIRYVHKGWIPNTLTLGNLVFGFLSIVFASKGNLPFSGLCILIAALCDGFDGQVARMLHVESSIGAQLDSLADCVTFGVAPGILAFNAYFQNIVVTVNSSDFHAGALVAVILPVCTAYRLARFNVSHSTTTFSGLPSPIAGVTIALIPITLHITGIQLDITRHLDKFVPFYIMISLLMVTTITFSKPQQIILSRIHGAKLGLVIFLVLVSAIVFKRWVLFFVLILLLIYLLSGLVSFVIQLIQDHRDRVSVTTKK